MGLIRDGLEQHYEAFLVLPAEVGKGHDALHHRALLLGQLA